MNSCICDTISDINEIVSTLMNVKKTHMTTILLNELSNLVGDLNNKVCSMIEAEQEANVENDRINTWAKIVEDTPTTRIKENEYAPGTPVTALSIRGILGIDAHQIKEKMVESKDFSDIVEKMIDESNNRINKVPPKDNIDEIASVPDDSDETKPNVSHDQLSSDQLSSDQLSSDQISSDLVE